MSRRILFVVSEDWYFVSHRLHLAVAAMKAGYEVALLSRTNNHKHMIEDAGIKVIDWSLTRRSHNPIKEFMAIVGAIRAFKECHPDIIHAVAVKPVLYSSIAAKYTGVRHRVFAFGGLGYIFSTNKFVAKLMKPIILLMYRFALSGNKSRLILQNKDDCGVLLSSGVIKQDRIRLIRGSGVDTGLFSPGATKSAPTVVLPARMLWDKGVEEFVECARLIKQQQNVTFALVGDPDRENPESIPVKQLNEWVDEGVVSWLGRRDDMPEVYKKATIVCLPSYREGLPKSLLEAASCGLPIVTYDVPGCREIVIHGKNGFLVPPKNVEELANSINILLNDKEMRDRFGKHGRDLVIKEFSQERVVEETLAVWEEVLS